MADLGTMDAGERKELEERIARENKKQASRTPQRPGKRGAENIMMVACL
jgi:hypothetical protein